MRNKEEVKPSVQKSKYEEQWSMSDYRDHEQEFIEMRKEIDVCIEKEKGSVVMGRWLWLMKQKAVKLTAINGIFEVKAISEYYSMMTAKYDRFTEWMAYREKKDSKYEENFLNVMNTARESIGIEKKVDEELESLEALAQTEIYNDHDY